MAVSPGPAGLALGPVPAASGATAVPPAPGPALVGRRRASEAGEGLLSLKGKSGREGGRLVCFSPASSGVAEIPSSDFSGVRLRDEIDFPREFFFLTCRVVAGGQPELAGFSGPFRYTQKALSRDWLHVRAVAPAGGVGAPQQLEVKFLSGSRVPMGRKVCDQLRAHKLHFIRGSCFLFLFLSW